VSGFPAALGVVRIQFGPGSWVASLPMPIGQARLTAKAAVDQLSREGDAAGLVGFDIDGAIDCWVRAREVLSVEVVPTEDPSA